MERLTGRLRQLSIWLPVAFVGSVAALAVLGLGDVLPSYAVVLVIAALTAVGAGLFSLVVFRIVSEAQRESEQRTRVLTAVNEAGRALTSDLDLQSVLQRVVELSREVPEANYGALALLGSDGKIAQFLTSGVTDEERARIGALPEGKGLLGEVIHRGAALRVDRIAEHPASSGFPPNHPPMTSFMGLPIVHEGRILGDLYLADKRGGAPFTRQDEEMLRAFATHAAIAIQNAQIYEQERQRAEEWKSLFELGEEVTASPDRRELLNSVAERAARLLDAEMASLILLEPDRKAFRVAAQAGVQTAEPGDLRRLEEHPVQRRVLESREPVIIPDVQADLDVSGQQSGLAAQEGLVSLIAVPFSVKGNVLGTLTVGNRDPTQFTERQAELLAAFANWAAVAVETSALYQQVQDLAVLEERDRIGMDLHDGVIQSLYATGLKLESCLDDLEHEPAAAVPELQKAIDQVNLIITDIRSYIFRLRPSVLAETDLAGAVGGLLQELKVNALMDVQLIEEPEACRRLSEEQTTALFHVAQESLTNVHKHAHARSVRARLATNNGVFTMTIEDDGTGFDPAYPAAGLGLRNMRERVESLGGRLEVASGDRRGTRLTIELPLNVKGA